MSRLLSRNRRGDYVVRSGDMVPECPHCGETIPESFFEQFYDEFDCAPGGCLKSQRETTCPLCAKPIDLSRLTVTIYGVYLTRSQCDANYEARERGESEPFPLQ